MALTAAPRSAPRSISPSSCSSRPARADEAAARARGARRRSRATRPATGAVVCACARARMLLRAGRAGDALAMVRPLVAAADVPRAARWLEQRILRAGEGARPTRSRRACAPRREAAEAAGDPPRAAALAYERGAARDQRRRDAIDSWRACWRSIPATAPPSSSWPRGSSDAERRAGELPALLQARLAAAGSASGSDRRSRCASARRCSKTPAMPPRAAALLRDAAQRAPGYAPAREGLDRVAARRRRSGRAPGRARARARRAPSRPSSASRSTLVLGERLERDGRPTRPPSATVRRSSCARATVARQALERALQVGQQLLRARRPGARQSQGRARPAGARSPPTNGSPSSTASCAAITQSALLGLESIIEVDHAHHAAMRVLEKQYLERAALARAGRALRADGPDRHRPGLRRRRCTSIARACAAGSRGGEVSPAELAAAVDNDYRLALFKDRRSPPGAAPRLRARAHRPRSRAGGRAAGALADAAPDDGRTAAVMLTRAAEALVELDRADDARAALRGRASSACRRTCRRSSA